MYLVRLAVAAVLVGALAPAAPLSAQEVREIVVTGEGTVDAAPDLATVTAGVETEAETAEEALAGTSAAMSAVMDVLEGAGIDRADVQTSSISLQPVWSDRRGGGEGPPEITGYTAANLVTVRVRDLAALGGVLDAVSGAGANRIHGIAFSLAEPRPQQDEARERAVSDARAKAELFARAAGVSLGQVVAIRETAPFDRPFPMRAMAEASMDVPVAEGTIELTAMVEMVFVIED